MHSFPEAARMKGLVPFKGHVQAKTQEQFVWWEDEETSGPAAANPFRFGHTIEVAVSKSTRHAYARVSVFSALTFAMELGEVDVVADDTVVTHIDPLADHPPNDIQVVRLGALALDVRKPDDLTSHLARIIESGAAQKRLGRLVGDIQSWNLERDMGRVFERLSSARRLEERERRGVVREVVEGQGQRVLNMMRYVAWGALSEILGAQANPVMQRFSVLVASDPASPSGLTSIAEEPVGRAKAALSDEIYRKLDGLSLDQLSMLLAGGPVVRSWAR
jgi:hypothetical protein